MTKKLFIFDVDGVLLNVKMGGLKDVLVMLGKEKEVQILEAEYQKIKHLGPWGLEEIVGLYRGRSINELKKLAEKYCGEALMCGAKEAVEGIKSKKYLVVAISSGPQFVLDVLKEKLDLDLVFGTQLEFSNGIATGKITKKIDRFTKKEILGNLIKDNKLSQKDVVAIGDSITDLPLGELAGKFIGFNIKDKEVEERADIVIKEKDLKNILKHI